MAGERSEHEPHGENAGGDDGEVAESTIAMGVPAFDLEGVPSPISDAPPAMPARHVAHTAPVGFKPAAAPAAGVPQLGRAKAPSSPLMPTPLGGIVPAPAPTPTAPTAGGVGLGPAGGARPRLRAQTVIGIAPAPPGAPRPVVVRQVAKAPAAREIPAFDPPPGPSAEDAFGLDADAAEAARAAAFKPAPRVPPPAASPPPAARERRLPSLDSTPPKADGETQTLAVPRDQLPPSSGPKDRMRDRLPSVNAYDQDEETKLRESDVHVQDARVVQDDASGDDATIAAPPRSNQALQHFNPAFAQTLASEGAAPRQSSPSFGHDPRPSYAGHEPHRNPVATPQPFQAPPWQGHAQHGQHPHAQAQAPMQHHPHAHGHAPMQPQHHHPMGAPQSYRAPTGPGVVPHGYPPPQHHGGPKISGQIILVAVVGVICVTVFIIGVVLFVTK